MIEKQENPEGAPPAPTVDGPGIQELLDTANEAAEVVKTEIKAQRLADAHGAIGWKCVSEYEGPELADDDDEAKSSSLKKLSYMIS